MSTRAPAWKAALYAAGCLGLLLGFFLSWADGSFPPANAYQTARIALVMVAFGGAFAGIAGYFFRSKIVPAVEDLSLEPGERLIHTGYADHGLHGGRFAVTDKRIVFMPHAMNIQRGQQLSLSRSEIATVMPARTLGIVPNGLKVRTRSGAVHRFSVNDRATWLRELAAEQA
ncbi:MAG: hypothetical protein AB7E81_13395 [Hyphomicrobiaceae bacterium]